MGEQCEDHNKFCEMMGGIGANIVNLTSSINTLNARIDGSFDVIAEHIRESVPYRTKIDQLETVMKLHIEAEERKSKDAMWKIGITVTVISVVVQIVAGVFLK